jgi:hypothetical protein
VIARAVAGAVLPLAVVPWPIGAGPRYQPPAAPPAIRGARPVGLQRCGSDSTRFSIHLELFANRRAIVTPAGIGVASPFRRVGAEVRPGDCVYRLHTTAPTGVIRVGMRNAVVGDIFRIWGQALGPRRLLTFSSLGRVRAFVNGTSRPGDPRTIPLTPHLQIVLEIRGYVPPHPRFLFPRGSR